MPATINTQTTFHAPVFSRLLKSFIRSTPCIYRTTQSVDLQQQDSVNFDIVEKTCGGNDMVYAITFAFIVLDFVTGLIKAVSSGKFKSSMMREGLFHKIGEILCIALGILIQYAEGYLDLGINLPVAGAICTYIVLMEIGSALENICAINPDLAASKLLKIIGIGREESDE
ncbi:MAG: phage holin family protein [Butyricicoccus porcorum]|nr:phage holin family protein [Butyricicoccus porcorum]